jgi:hypothetical protein
MDRSVSAKGRPVRHRPSGRRRRGWFAACAAAFGVGAFATAAGAATPTPTPCPPTGGGPSPCYTVAPTITPANETANPPEGRYLTASTGTWMPAGPVLTQQWQRCDAATGLTCNDIPGAAARTYKVVAADVGSRLQIVMRARNSAGSGYAVVQLGVAVAAVPINRGAPRISGVAQIGQTLTGATGTWDGTMPISYAYQWRRCDAGGANCRTIPGAVSGTYVVGSSDLGHTLREYVTATNPVGSASVHSFATAVVTPPSSGSPPPPNGGGSPPTGGGSPPKRGGPAHTVTSAQIRALLANALVARGKGATIGALLKHGGYSVTFAAPVAGRLVMSWYRMPRHGKRTLVASATSMFHKAGTARIKLTLTRRGRRLLSHARKLKLTARGGFAPSGQGSTKVSRLITLTRRPGKV